MKFKVGDRFIWTRGVRLQNGNFEAIDNKHTIGQITRIEKRWYYYVVLSTNKEWEYTGEESGFGVDSMAANTARLILSDSDLECIKELYL